MRIMFTHADRARACLALSVLREAYFRADRAAQSAPSAIERIDAAETRRAIRTTIQALAANNPTQEELRLTSPDTRTTP